MCIGYSGANVVWGQLESLHTQKVHYSSVVAAKHMFRKGKNTSSQDADVILAWYPGTYLVVVLSL